MKTQQKSAYNKRKNRQRRDVRDGASRSLYQRITKSWVLNTLIVPVLITLLSAALTLLLAHWGK